MSLRNLVPRAGLEPAQVICPRDFKSLASTNSATQALGLNKSILIKEAGAGLEPACIRLCRPLHNHSATQPYYACNVLARPGIRLEKNYYWSGKRDSNSRPQPWQGCALPTELFPRSSFSFLHPYISSCQVFPGYL